MFQILREISHYESARQKNETSDMHENLIDYTQDILIHIATKTLLGMGGIIPEYYIETLIRPKDTLSKNWSRKILSKIKIMVYWEA